ncbi:LacI family DNA-binding transcriptional regulator [Paracoccus beibuensis]|uniref:LacI family DNA-binding transcriptional regulator n=1 Tax=Paracoccus beibuensis TaxID=547602 RepID=UPI002240A7B3|nr:LacI family DNA-binding transcriptional regulator [Paracoccus beibuensis]
MRTTISEIAQRAGVSPATVDRVLNERSGVRDRTRDIVMATARDLGYFGPTDHQRASRVRLDVVLPAGQNSFMLTLRSRIIDECVRREDVDLRIHDVDRQDDNRIESKLVQLRGQTDAIGIVAPDRPEIRELLNDLAQSGIHVATLVSDIPSIAKVGYVGIDNRAAGRLAGLLLGRLLSPVGEGDIALFVGSRAYRGHEEREMGFRSILSDEFPELRITAYAEVGDDRDRAYEEMKSILRGRRIAGLYNIGSGNQGIGRALREAKLARETIFIGHDLTNATRLLLLERTLDAVIDQNPRVEAREIVRMLVSAAQGRTEPDYPPRNQVIFRENIPLD